MYATPTVPSGREVVEMVNPGWMVMLRAFVVVCGIGVVESLAITVKFEIPAVVGVPEMTPVLASIDRPGGRLPALIFQLTGSVPYDSWTVAV